MGVLNSIATVKTKLGYQGMMCMLLVYAQKHTSSVYSMLIFAQNISH